ncbi:ephrin-B2a-like [Chironomus tepperi]|uniref:ephrin-B2a-like n=1 Tax=Chironomus tepperi TaxID=113505 RepID=UPI00391FC990
MDKKSHKKSKKFSATNSNDHRKSTKVKNREYSGMAATCYRHMSFKMALIFILIELLLIINLSHGAKSFYLHWNTTNPIFRIDNNDHVIDVNRGNLKFEYDLVHIICPYYEAGTNENETERYIIYNVSKVEYETCRITNPNPRIIAICDKPFTLTLVTISFRPFTPQPGGLEFKPGNDYYFISTSSKDDIHRRIGGRCTTNNTKVIFKVFGGEETQRTTVSPSTNDKPPPFNDWKTHDDSSDSTNSENDESNKINYNHDFGHGFHSTQRPFFVNSNNNVNNNDNFNNISGSKPPKKTNEHDTRQNEVVKNEELTYNNATSRSNYALSAALSCLIIILMRNGRST